MPQPERGTVGFRDSSTPIGLHAELPFSLPYFRSKVKGGVGRQDASPRLDGADRLAQFAEAI